MANIPVYIPTFISSIDYQPAIVYPRLYFYNGLVECEQYYIKDENNIPEVQSSFPYVDFYNVPSGSTFPTEDSKTILFQNEQPVYGSVPNQSLYQAYWDKYISLLYDPRTRLLNCNGIIPLAEYFKMALNDIIQFRGNYYHLRAINNYDLKTGECDIELLGPILEGSLNITS